MNEKIATILAFGLILTVTISSVILSRNEQKILELEHARMKDEFNRTRQIRLNCHDGAEKHAIDEYNREKNTNGDIYLVDDYVRIFENCLRRNNVE